MAPSYKSVAPGRAGKLDPSLNPLASQMLHRDNADGEAVARIGGCLNEKALGVITGEVVAGKIVVGLAGLDASRTTIVFLGNPAVGGDPSVSQLWGP